LLVLAAAAVLVFGMGWHRYVSFETLVRHHAVIEALVERNIVAATAGYIALYVIVVALSIPGATVLTVAGGMLFGALLGGAATLIGATAGAVCVFLIARSAVGERLARRAGRLAEQLADGFRADAFNYLLFLRLVPVFPFWLVNLVPALCGVRLSTFAAATAIGIVPATFAYAFFGAGLESAVAAQRALYDECVSSGKTGCRLDFDFGAAITPELLAALAVLGVVALAPVAVKRWRARARVSSAPR
jgi:uncharacterized membrane protein YdjX (TVP38/TMEM64 family)